MNKEYILNNSKKISYKKCFFFLLAVSWFSGIIFLIFDNFIEIEGDFGIENHPAQYLFLKIHGASSFLILVAFGYFLSAHVKKNLYSRTKRGIRSGLSLIIMTSLMIISAYLLYYIPDNFVRDIAIYTHIITGSLLPFILIFHIFLLRHKKGKVMQVYKRDSLGYG
jgi:hypothetical protein